MIDSLLISPVSEVNYLNTHMRKFESSQKESRAQSADSSKPIENLLDLLLVHDSRVSYFFRLVRIECN